MFTDYLFTSFVLGMIGFFIVALKTKDHKLAIKSSLFLGFICIAFVFNPFNEIDNIGYITDALTAFSVRLIWVISWIAGIWTAITLLKQYKRNNR